MEKLVGMYLLRESATMYGIGKITAVLSEHAVLVQWRNMTAGDDRSTDWRFEVVAVAAMATEEYEIDESTGSKCYTLFESEAAMVAYLAWLNQDVDNTSANVIEISKRKSKPTK